MMEEDQTLKFETHNGMARVAMFAGIPVFALLFLVVGGVISLFIGIYSFGWWGLTFALPAVLALIFLRLICQKDDKAFRRFWFWRRRKKLDRQYGRLLLLTPRHSAWRNKNARRSIQKRIIAGE
ncbi:hypothetical protein CWM94_00140 [Klebsiella pneumoniae]|nr:hypothetical protein CWM94_00140 [Klebsiella pneumoniae]